MSEARERGRAGEEEGEFQYEGKDRRPHTAYSTGCVCVGGVNTETVCKLSIRISESFIPEAVCVYPVMLLRMK